MSQPQTRSFSVRAGFEVYAHDDKFNVSRAAAASAAVLIRTGASFADGEYQNGRDGASGTGRSSLATASDKDDRPSINPRTCWKRDQPISSSVRADPRLRSVSSQRAPNFDAEFTASAKEIEPEETSADSNAVPI